VTQEITVMTTIFNILKIILVGDFVTLITALTVMVVFLIVTTIKGR
jgi:hypothetical protein